MALLFPWAFPEGGVPLGAAAPAVWVAAVLGALLWALRAVDGRVTLGTALLTALVGGFLGMIDPTFDAGWPLALWTQGFWLGAIWLAGDPTVSPLSPRGKWAFALGVGALSVLLWGLAFPGRPGHAVVFGVFAVAALTPWLDRVTRPRPFGVNRAE